MCDGVSTRQTAAAGDPSRYGDRGIRVHSLIVGVRSLWPRTISRSYLVVRHEENGTAVLMKIEYRTGRPNACCGSVCFSPCRNSLRIPLIHGEKVCAMQDM